MKINDIPKSMLDMLAFRIDGDEPWEAPSPIEFALRPVSSFTPDLLPEELVGYVTDEAHRMQCPPDFVAVALLVTIGSVIGSGCAIRPKQLDTWTVVPNLWGGFVGRPGMLKTPALKSGTAFLGTLEHEAKLEHDAAIARFLTRKAEREYDLKQLKAANAEAKFNLSVEEIRHRILDITRLDQEDKEPKLRRYRTNDATVEKIGELVADSQRGLIFVRDELVGLLANCDKQGHEGDRSFFLEAWEGQSSFTTDRIGRGNVYVPKLCLSLFGGIQPEKLQQYLYATLAGYGNDGLFQRFQLMVYPDERAEKAYVDEKPDDAAKEKIVKILRALAATDFVTIGAQPGDGGVTPYFRFAEKAQPLFVTWYKRMEAEIEEEETPVVAEHIGKYRKLIPSLALIFHLVALAAGKKYKAPGISKEALQRAIKWHDYLLSHARRIYSLGGDPLQPAVTTLIARIRSGKLVDGFSERDVYKAGWTNLIDAEVVRSACRELEQDQWIRRIPTERGSGRPASSSYLINPLVKAA